MCLFRGKIGWMENFGKKMGMKTFWSVFGWVEKKENKLYDLGVFSSDPSKSFLSKTKRKMIRKIGHYF